MTPARRLSLSAAGMTALVLLGILVATLLVHGGSSGHLRRRRDAALPSSAPAARPPASTGAALIAALDRAQAIIDDPASGSREVARAGLFEQLATRALEHAAPVSRRRTLARLGPQAAASMRADLAAAAALSAIVPVRAGLPRWRIVEPPAPGTLLGYFRAAQARFGVPWEDLAAIELIETRFGRIQGWSPAGARGPMQFMPATWARYGAGRIDDQHDAILGAARYLRASGAPRDLPDALYHYNNSRDYVRAVEDYAGRMHADPRAYYGYYWWQVLYARTGGPVILPTGYPKARPVPVTLAQAMAPAGPRGPQR